MTTTNNAVKGDNKTQDAYSDQAQMNARSVSEWYDRIVTATDKCPFCDLKDKYIIQELDGMVLTVNLFPYIDGHLMIVPRRHIEALVDLTDQEIVASKKLMDTGMRLLREELDYVNINVMYREGSKNSGSSLKHLHIHILPITEDFLHYEKTQFTWIFQKIKFPPREIAERFRARLHK